MMRKSFIYAVFAFAFGIHAVSAAQTGDKAARAPVDIKAVIARLPRSNTSADGLVRVVAADVPGDEIGFRAPILNFTMREIRAVAATYKITAPSVRDPAIVIYALDGHTNDTRVISRVRRRRGIAETRIWLPSPGFSDLELLRVAVVTAYLRACSLDFPEWVVQGLMRGTDIDVEHADERMVLKLWSEARLPFFPALCTDLRPAKGRAAALAGYVVSWMKEKKLIDVWRKRFEAGEKWDGKRLAKDLTGETDPVLQDRASDERLVRLTNSVLSPGRASEWDFSVFCSRLLLYPPFFDKIYRTESPYCTFGEAISLAKDRPDLRQAAFQRAREVPLYAIGRGEDLAAAAFAYSDFLMALSKGKEPPERLDELLSKANGLLRKARRKVKKDE